MHDLVRGALTGGHHISGALRQALHSWDSLLESLPIAVYVCDARGVIVQYNQRAVEFWGRAPQVGDDSELFSGMHGMQFGGHRIDRDETPMARVLRSGEAVHGAECVVERPDGTRSWTPGGASREVRLRYEHDRTQHSG